jgi:hypothetical protein
MRTPPWPTIRYFKAYVAMAGLAILVLGMTMLMMRPRPAPAPAPGWRPEWRCNTPAEGDPICVRELPPAARPAAR